MKPRHHLYLDDELSARARRARIEAGLLQIRPSSPMRSGPISRARGGKEAGRPSSRRASIAFDQDSSARVERESRSAPRKPGALSSARQLTVTAPLPESEQAAARAAGEDRYQAFIEQLGRRVAAGRGIGRELAERVGESRNGVVGSAHEPAGRTRKPGAPARHAAHRAGPVISGCARRARTSSRCWSIPTALCGSTGLGEGRVATGVRLGAAEAERIIRLVADHVGVEAMPAIADRQRRTAAARGVRRTLRGHAAAGGAGADVRDPHAGGAAIYTLADYVADRRHARARGGALSTSAMRKRRNVVIAGGAKTGKTTLANALLAADRRRDRRPAHPAGGPPRDHAAARQCRAAARQGRRGVALRSGALGAAAVRPTASPSARSAAARRSTCWRPGAPAIPAASPRSMPSRRSARSTGSSSSSCAAVANPPRELIAEAVDIVVLSSGPQRPAPHRDDRRGRRPRRAAAATGSHAPSLHRLQPSTPRRRS